MAIHVWLVAGDCGDELAVLGSVPDGIATGAVVGNAVVSAHGDGDVWLIPCCSITHFGGRGCIALLAGTLVWHAFFLKQVLDIAAERDYP